MPKPAISVWGMVQTILSGLILALIIAGIRMARTTHEEVTILKEKVRQIEERLERVVKHQLREFDKQP